MWRYLAGGMASLLVVAVGWFLFNARARADSVLPQAPPRAMAGEASGEPLPDMVPEATPQSREQKRFGRYDKDRDGAVTRDEYLASRRKAYAKLDVNGDGKLSFDEWSVKTLVKFATADKDKSGAMTPGEFAATAVKRSTKPRPKCLPLTRVQLTSDSGDDGEG